MRVERGHVRGAIAAKRLSFLPRLLQQAPDELFYLMQRGGQCNESWVAQLQEDWTWLCQHAQNSLLPTPSSSWQARVEFISNYKGWKNIVRKALAVFNERETKVAQIHHRGRSNKSQVKQEDVNINEGEEWLCPTCGQIFATRDALGMHRATAHGWRQPVRCRFLSWGCGLCLNFHCNRGRMLEHLNKNTACWDWYLQQPVLDAEDIEEADLEEAKRQASYKAMGLRPNAAIEPWRKMQGPRRREAAGLLREANEQRKARKAAKRLAQSSLQGAGLQVQ